MTLLMMDGIDWYNSQASALHAGWSPGHTSMGASATEGRFGGGALSGTTSGRFWRIPEHIFLELNDTVIIQWAIKFASNHPYPSGSSNDILILKDFANEVCYLTSSSSGALFFKNDSGTFVGNINRAGQLIANEWNYIQCKFTFNGSTGSAEAKINGTSSITATGADFFNSNGITEIDLLGNNQSTWYIDDIVIMDGTGSRLNDFIGDCRISTILPNSDVLEEWTQSESGPSYELVDDALGAPPDDTTYLESATPGDEHRFGFENCPSNTNEVHALNVVRQGRKIDASDRTIRSLVVSNSVEEVAPRVSLGDDYQLTRDLFLGDPGQGSPTVDWNETSINAIEIGVEVVT